MTAQTYELLLLGALTAAANVLGGLILISSGIYKRYIGSLKYLLALGAGFMLGVTVIELLPKSISLWQTGVAWDETRMAIPVGLLLGGYLLTQFLEHTIAPHIHLGEEVHSDPLISTSSAYTAVGGLLMHTFFDGVSISAASQVDYRVGLLVFIAVFLHKFPEGFTVASLVLAAGKGHKQVLIANLIVGLTSFLGVIIFLLIGNGLGFTVAYALPFSAGVTLYVAASDLIPEVNHHGGKRPLVSVFVFAGVALFFLLHYLLHTTLEN